MTTTLERADTDVVEAHEFDVPCIASAAGCPNSADWSLWLAHAEGGCGITGFICGAHKAVIDRVWAAAVRFQPDVCPHCHQGISPHLGDNIRWIPLRAKGAA